MGRTLLFVPLGVYLFVYPNGIWLLALGLMPPGAGWVGGILLIAQAAAMLTWLALNYGVQRGLLAGLLIGMLAWALEAVGVSTGVPFGVYSYTTALGVFLGPVPLAIPFAWIATVGAALGTARLLLNRPTDAWVIATLAALLAAGQDFVLEPIATFMQGYWNWHDEAALVYGVPAQNFLTWFVASLLLARLALAIVGLRSASYYPWLPPLLVLLAVFMFGLLDLVGGYYLAALLALPLLIGAALLVARVFPRRLRRLGRALRLGRSLRAIIPLLLVGAIALQGCGGDDIFVILTPTPVATVTIPPTSVPTATIPPTSTPLPPTDTPIPTVTPTPAPPTATPVVLAPDPSTTSTLLLGALDAMEALASYEYTATVSSHGPGTTVANSISGVFQAPDRLYWTNATKAITSEQVLSGTLYYVAYTPGEWIQAGGAAKARNTQLLWPLVAYGEDAELIDQPVEDGETLLHIGFRIPPAKLLLDSRNWIKATAEVWLSSTTRRVLALKLIAYDETYDTTQRYYFFNFDASVQIPQPAP